MPKPSQQDKNAASEAKSRVPHVIRVSSYKGGVGKTAISINLAVALRSRGYKVLLIDEDTTNPSIGFVLGMNPTDYGLPTWLNGKASLKEVLSVHAPTGLHVVNGLLSEEPYSLDEKMGERMASGLKNSSYDFVVIDTEPGIMAASLPNIVTDALVVTTPSRPSLSSAIRMIKAFNSRNVQHSVVINRVSHKGYELNLGEIRNSLDSEIVSSLPEDELVPISAEQKIPVLLSHPRSPFSQGIKALADKYSRRAGYSSISTNEPEARNAGFIYSIMKAIRNLLG